MNKLRDTKFDQRLLFARAYEDEVGKKIDKNLRPSFHLTPYIGWTNDPNGFSFYKGVYHLFYQYNPYSLCWDSMHWGHAISKDMLKWEYLPAALAPDEAYDADGVFSGSSIALPDGKQLLMYTGVKKEGGVHGSEFQTQCIAIGDGLNYTKYKNNPVLDQSVLPSGFSKKDFRDPKIFKDEDGIYRCVVGTRDENKNGHILTFSSADCFTWKYEGVLVSNDGRLGCMWECPDLFPLDGQWVLLCSPQDMLPSGLEYHNGNGTLCLIGELNNNKNSFTYTHDQSIDYGIDFYAAQTTLAPDGRRIMIGWMQNWDTCKISDDYDLPWFGQMTLPREISIKNGRLYQAPVRELNAYRTDSYEYKNILVTKEEQKLYGVEGRVLDMTVTIRQAEKKPRYQKFRIRFAQNEKYWTDLIFTPEEEVLQIDRKFSGSRRAFIHQRRCHAKEVNGELKLRIILDRYSAEVFVNDGEKTITITLMTEQNAKGISFYANGEALIDVEKHSLEEKETK